MLKFRSDIKVDLTDQYGDDLSIARAAWVSSGKGEDIPSEKRIKGVVRALLREKHGTPFEAGYFSFLCEAPRAVRDEAFRHRHVSPSSESLRYAGARQEVYIPPQERPFNKAENFKQIQPEYVPMGDYQYNLYVQDLKNGYGHANMHNESIKKYVHSTEASRWLTHDGTYFAFILRFNPRSLMHFLALRTHNRDANHVSYPMWEIEKLARSIEDDFAKTHPYTYEAFVEFGREAP